MVSKGCECPQDWGGAGRREERNSSFQPESCQSLTLLLLCRLNLCHIPTGKIVSMFERKRGWVSK